MKRTSKWDKRWIVGGALALAVVVVAVIVLVTQLRGPAQFPTPTYWPTQAWLSSTPEEQGFDSVKLAEGILAMREKGIRIHSLLIIRNGSVILDAYFYPYDGSNYHDLASVTKSLMTTLIGIAADQGELDLDQPMVSFFPDRTIAHLDDRKEHITVRHLASMVNGFESGCLRGDEPTLDAMRANADWVQGTLDREMVREPGTVFCYDSPGMHLLSAILQEATGMKALDFARQNLFAPLGIDDVYWPSDPQGYTHGWGDACLRPRDAAKIGYLWLNNGVWEDKQIVSAAWVQDSVTAQSRSGGDDYGYGWWVSEEGYEASGRGVQKIIVLPSLNLIVVMTGGGFESDEIDPYLRAALVDPNKPLPPNSAGVDQLDAALAAVAQGPAPQPVPSLPATASAVSGSTYVLEPNPVNLRSVRLDFDGSSEAVLQLEVAYEPAPRVAGVGLDGVYRNSRFGRPTVASGYWEDDQTFIVDYLEGPGLAAYTFRIRFDGDQMLFGFPGLGSFEGRVEKP
ncbi:MAG: beta-lactamase family protein [Anaerolineae bacterium]|nr:beta-lactamase family protein [Anaerolineae bacterium]